MEAAKVTVVESMSPEKFNEISSGVSKAMEPDILRATQGIEQFSTEEDVIRYRAYMEVLTLIANLANARLSHNVSHELYKTILNLLKLIGRLVIVLGASVLLVLVAASTALDGISDALNAPIAITLIGWILWLLVCLFREIKGAVRLEEQIHSAALSG